MSIVDGEHCAWSACHALSFLPLVCPQCKRMFCEAHVQPEKHVCTALTSRPEARATASRRDECHKTGCHQPSLHVRVSDTPSFQHRAPQCDRCHGYFCAMYVQCILTHRHRSPFAHGCKASAPPTEGDRKRQEAADRKAKARALLSQRFPNFATK